MTTFDPFRAEEPHTRLPPPEPLEGRRPRLLAHVLRAFPMHFAGAERMLHEILEGLTDRGWDCRIVAVEHKGGPYEWNGIPVEALTDAQMADPYAWCDLALTHLDVTGMAMAWARYGRPLLHLTHNHTQLRHHRVPDDGRNIAVWNSEWIIAESGGWRGPQIIVRPPVRPELHATVVKNRHKLRTATLVNLLGEKGGPLFWRLARRLPDWKFIGVRGAYGMSVEAHPMPPNGTVLPNGTPMTDVWARTSVLLAPSWYESYSCASTEAICSSIPVLAHPTPGLQESMAGAAQFIDRDDDDAWVAALRSLEAPKAYDAASFRAWVRSRELAEQSISDLDRLDVFCRHLAQANQPVEEPA